MVDQGTVFAASPLAVGLGTFGPGIGLGLMASAYFTASARQPEMQGKLSSFFFISAALIEVLGALGFVAFFMVLSNAVPK